MHLWWAHQHKYKTAVRLGSAGCVTSRAGSPACKLLNFCSKTGLERALFIDSTLPVAVEVFFFFFSFLHLKWKTNKHLCSFQKVWSEVRVFLFFKKQMHWDQPKNYRNFLWHAWFLCLFFLGSQFAEQHLHVGERSPAWPVQMSRVPVAETTDRGKKGLAGGTVMFI